MDQFQFGMYEVTRVTFQLFSPGRHTHERPDAISFLVSTWLPSFAIGR
jgi:hypothetical protein